MSKTNTKKNQKEQKKISRRQFLTKTATGHCWIYDFA